MRNIMKQSRITIFTLLIIVLLGCKQNENDINHKTFKAENKNIRKIDKTIQNVYDISKDTIIACKYEKGLIISKNAGETWTNLDTTLLFDDLTLTDKGILVGLDSWQGIHEADYSKFYISKDFGKKWTIITIDTEKIFPLNIFSNPKEQLTIITTDKKIYKLTGPDLQRDWTFVKSLVVPEIDNIIRDFPFEIDDYNNRNIKLLKSNGKNKDTIITLKNCQEVNDIINYKDIVHISGLSYKLNSVINHGYYAQYKSKNNFKEFEIPGHYTYIKKTQLGNIYIMSDEGLFIERNGKIKRLY
jgi:hypothetical protein